MTVSTADIMFTYVVPFLGTITANLMNAAPIAGLREALAAGTLGDLNPLPWVIMTGNCFGWCAYAYYMNDPYILASNLPGLLISVWLNQGAIKLQYYHLRRVRCDSLLMMTKNADINKVKNINKNRSNSNSTLLNEDEDQALLDYNNGEYSTATEEMSTELQPLQPKSRDPDSERTERTEPMSESSELLLPPYEMIFVSQEIKWYQMLVVWSSVLVWLGWISPLLADKNSQYMFLTSHSLSSTEVIGFLVNINLIFFYGAPLTSIVEVWQTKKSTSIHRPSMYMALMNATLWATYGFTQNDMVIMLPNLIGMSLGIMEFVLSQAYPGKEHLDGGDINIHNITTARTMRRQVVDDSTIDSESSPCIATGHTLVYGSSD
ncbi:unnamed protein product [Cylindrotheca closterium]|uniref:Sugar transporter SWEET1 n=1 Tax=Cylindrotheca closterium TaxID=2856 RepID=A0AAD2FR08_9STRA|nr:unnamed protein product [Cylindrotheca closterium]